MKLELSSLNPKQREAVTYNSGPLIILAGAGSGKTRVLTYKAAYLIEQLKADPSQILMVTFTNKAAGEMKERIIKLVGGSKAPQAGTFHSFCAKVLRSLGKDVELDPSFVIYDEDDQLTAIKLAISACGFSEK